MAKPPAKPHLILPEHPHLPFDFYPVDEEVEIGPLVTELAAWANPEWLVVAAITHDREWRFHLQVSIGGSQHPPTPQIVRDLFGAVACLAGYPAKFMPLAEVRSAPGSRGVHIAVPIPELMIASAVAAIERRN